MKDIFMKDFVTMDAAHVRMCSEVKQKAEELYKLLDTINNREMSLAKTNLEQALMWSTKAIVFDFVAQNKETPDYMQEISK